MGGIENPQIETLYRTALYHEYMRDNATNEEAYDAHGHIFDGMKYAMEVFGIYLSYLSWSSCARDEDTLTVKYKLPKKQTKEQSNYRNRN